MIYKTLQVAEALFLNAPQIRGALGDRWPEFEPLMRKTHESLARGPHPEFSDPLIDALKWCFTTPAETIVSGILDAHGFDYRFITGRRRRFSALRNPDKAPERLVRLWERVLGKSDAFMKQVDG